MFSFLIEVWSTEKSYAVQFKEISLCSTFTNFLICFLNKNHTNLCYPSPNICQSLFYLYISNFYHNCNKNLRKILYLLY